MHFSETGQWVVVVVDSPVTIVEETAGMIMGLATTPTLNPLSSMNLTAALTATEVYRVVSVLCKPCYRCTLMYLHTEAQFHLSRLTLAGMGGGINDNMGSGRGGMNMSGNNMNSGNNFNGNGPRGFQDDGGNFNVSVVVGTRNTL